MSTRFQTFPKLLIERLGDKLRIVNLVHKTGIRADLSTREILDFFEQPKSLDQFRATFPSERPGVIEYLENQLLLVKEEELDFLKAGFVAEVSNPIGKPCLFRHLRREAAPGRAVILGAPIDIGAGGAPGARFGPHVVRDSFPARPSKARGDDVLLLDFEGSRRFQCDDLGFLDVGNIAWHAGESLDVFGRRMSKAVAEIADLDMVPVTIGGDHSVTWFALRELLDRHDRMGIIHFDAHHDMYAGPFPHLSHATTFVYACEHASLQVLLQVGLRGWQATMPRTELVHDARIRFVTSRQVQSMTPETVFADMPRDIPYYLTFDVDCLSPSIAPETGTPVVGGLSYYQAQELLCYAFDEFRLVGVDFVEVAHFGDGRNSAAAIVGDYLARFLVSTCPSTEMEGYVFRWL